jgi:hypothetical protein
VLQGLSNFRGRSKPSWRGLGGFPFDTRMAGWWLVALRGQVHMGCCHLDVWQASEPCREMVIP